jgi:hypothetical protein
MHKRVGEARYSGSLWPRHGPPGEDITRGAEAAFIDRQGGKEREVMLA